ncbi:MAG: LysR family transcriptional regulator [Herbiconiux sp.]|nr:LysR family transcriptional regulator [Herbiconiux sp.]
METRLLEYFVNVADEQNVTRASERLFVAQSTVSAGLRSLERDLGVRLFERTTKTVQLLPAGEALLPLARSLLDDVEGLRAVAGQSATGLRGRVRIGTFAGLQLLDLPRVLGRFRREHPLVDVQLVASASGSTGLVDDLARGRLDLAFSALPTPPDLDAWPVARYPFVVLVPAGHRFAEAGRPVALAELAGEDWIDLLPGYGNRVLLDAALADRGLARHVAAELAELPSVALYVAAGLGVAVIPEVEGIEGVEGCVVLLLRDPLGPWVVSLAVRHGATRRPHLRALIESLRAGTPGGPEGPAGQSRGEA